MTRVLITRKLSAEQRILAAKLGLEVVEAPTTQTVFPESWAGLEATFANLALADAWVFTSANGVEGMRRFRESSKKAQPPAYLFAIGAKTAQALQRVFPDRQILAPETATATALAVEIAKHPVKQVLHWCGEKRRQELRAGLAHENVALMEIIVYKTESLVQQIDLTGVEGVLACSPSQVQALGERKHLAGCACFAIGATTAEAFGVTYDLIARVPTTASVEALFRAAAAFFNR